MNILCKAAFLATVALFGTLAVVFADTHAGKEKEAPRPNAYYLYTGAVHVSDSGVAHVPSRFKWSVETSWSGQDARGNDLPDSRIMLRLYDPDHNFTALTAQMDLATAAKLHRELGEIVAKKRQDPSFQHRPQLYDPKDIPPRGLLASIRTAMLSWRTWTPPSNACPARSESHFNIARPLVCGSAHACGNGTCCSERWNGDGGDRHDWRRVVPGAAPDSVIAFYTSVAGILRLAGGAIVAAVRGALHR